MTYTPPGMIAVDEITRAVIEHRGTPFHDFLAAVLSARRNTFDLTDRGRKPDSLPGLDPRRLPAMFGSYDSRPGGRDRPRIARLWARDVRIADNMHFSSRSMMMHSTATGPAGSEYEVPAGIVIDGMEMPETLATAFVGEHVGRIVKHPALEHPDLIVAEVATMEPGVVRIGLKPVRVNVGPDGRGRTPVRESGDFPLR